MLSAWIHVHVCFLHFGHFHSEYVTKSQSIHRLGSPLSLNIWAKNTVVIMEWKKEPAIKMSSNESDKFQTRNVPPEEGEIQNPFLEDNHSLSVGGYSILVLVSDATVISWVLPTNHRFTVVNWQPVITLHCSMHHHCPFRNGFRSDHWKMSLSYEEIYYKTKVM